MSISNDPSLPRFSVGAKVQSKQDLSRVGVVQEIGQLYGGIQYYRVFWGGPAGSRNVPETDLQEFKEATTPGDNLRNGNLASYQDFQRLITYHRLLRDHPLSNHIYAFNASRTRFYPYQFKPLMKFLDSPHHRVLICDEVGLGKTIEAGLILTEFRARETVQRVLVVCPSNLTTKWRWEMKRRFGEDFRVLRSRDLLDYCDEYEEYPDRTSINAIVSLETCRSKNVLERLESLRPEFDLVIVDEAHHMRNFGRKQRRVGVNLSQSSTAMIMLTATPIHLGNQNLYSLLNILDEEGFRDQETVDQLFRENAPIVAAQNYVSRIPPDLAAAISSVSSLSAASWVQDNPLYDEVISRLERVSARASGSAPTKSSIVQLQKDLSELNLIGHIFTRTRKREVHENVARRRASAVEITFTKLEQDLYNAVTSLMRAESEALGHLPIVVQWRLHMPQRRLASCIPAMVAFYKERLGLDEEDQPDDLSYREEVEEDESVSSPVDLSTAQQQLRALVSQWPDTASDSKFLELIKVIERSKRDQGQSGKMLVFSFFKATLRYLRESLNQRGLKSLVLSGDVDPEDRESIINRFKDDSSIQVLLCSRVASEGLDFQFCDTMVNYDLPWNPMEVEQRIGRLDRIGQKSQVISICNFWVKGTIEERILRRLYDRIGIFEHSIGDLEVIIGEAVQNLERELLSKDLTDQEQQQRLEQVAMVLERNHKDLIELERSAAQFIGTDQYFLDEVEAIRTRRRYVTGEQIYRFLSDFVRRQTPRTRLTYNRGTKTGRLHADEELVTVLRRHCKPVEITRYMERRSSSDGVPITFESEVAYEKPDVDFINVLHPLVNAITQEYDLESANLLNAHFVNLQSKLLPSGYYFYFVYLLKISAARARNSLECIIIDVNLNPIQDEAICETLLGEMVENGYDAGELIEIDPSKASEAQERALGLFLQRLSDLRRTNTEYNDRFLDRRLKSLKSFYEKRIGHHQKLLSDGQTKGSKEHYLRMQAGRIANLEAERDQKLAELECKRTIGEEHDEVAAGVVRIIQQGG